MLNRCDFVTTYPNPHRLPKLYRMTKTTDDELHLLREQVKQLLERVSQIENAALKAENTELLSRLGLTSDNAVHDSWSSYFNLNQSQHVLCGAHLLRDLQRQIDSGSNWLQAMHRFLLEQLPQPELSDLLLRERYPAILVKANREELPPQISPRGKPKSTVGRNLLRCLQQHEDAV